MEKAMEKHGGGSHGKLKIGGKNVDIYMENYGTLYWEKYGKLWKR